MQRSSCAVTENGSYVAYAPGIPCLLGSALLSIRLMDWWSHRLLVIPAIGTGANGKEIHGNWYDYPAADRCGPLKSGKPR